MFNNELLEEKYRIQRIFSTTVNFDLIQYSNLTHQKVIECEKKYQIQFFYNKPEII